MPYAVTHVILTIIIADMFRDYISKKKFPMFYVLLAGIAGLMPDLDIPASWIFNFIFGTEYSFHRLFTHSVAWAAGFFLIGILFRLVKKDEYAIFKWKVRKSQIFMFFMALAFGWFMHILLDCSFAADGLLNWFPGFPLNFCPHPFGNEFLIGFDAIILVLWLIHEQWRHEIRDFI